MGDRQFLSGLIDIFLDDSPFRLRALRAATAVADAQSLECVAHSFKANAGNMGARRVQALCFELERRGRDGSLDDAERLVREITAEYGQARDALDSERVMLSG